MNLKDAIYQRRSIRKFKEKPLDPGIVEAIIDSAIAAPSGKNLQPWHFFVLVGQKKDELVEILTRAAKKLQEKGTSTGSCLNSARAMAEAPCVIVIFNTRGNPKKSIQGSNRYLWSVDIQSIGGAIQNMLLQATSLGVGSLWICDVFYADREITEWLGRNDELVAAVALGYPDEKPKEIPRKKREAVTDWNGED